MRKRVWRRVFAMFLAVAIVLSNHVVSLAEWEDEWHNDWEEIDACECVCCGAELWEPDEFCECGIEGPHCSESHDADCWSYMHCDNFDECGHTIMDGPICDDCGLCEDCQQKKDKGDHCDECGYCGSPICYDCSEDGHLICEECCVRQGYHCSECEGCFQDITVCDKSQESGSDEVMCKECCEAAGNHCTLCHEHCDDDHWCDCDGGPGDHCFNCSNDAGIRYCEGCSKYFCPINGDDPSTEYCDNCGLCLDCCYEKITHCPLCEQEVEELCESDGEHGIECCDICEQCERCLLVEEIERCEHCEFCLECCRENAEEEGCSCGEFCKEESGFAEHICEECGRCFGEIPKCEYCGLCEECCAQNSENEGCSDGMCVEDPEFADHFCEECGECFHSVERCWTCEEAGANVCKDCCVARSANLGCDHGICSNSDYWKCHFDAEHGECYVNEDIGEDQHDFRDSTTCYVCGAQRDGTPHIIVQPMDRTIKVGKDTASAEKATFSVTAQGFNLTYQWYNGLGNKLTENEYYKGVNTKTLTICQTTCYADIDAAIAKAEAENDVSKANMLTQLKKGMNTFYCVVTNSESNRSATSATATVMSKHNVTEYRADVENHNYHYNSVSYKPQNGEAVKLSWKTTDTHAKVCVGSYWNLDNEDGAWRKALGACDKHEESEPHVWSSWNYNTEYPAYKGQTGYASRTCMVCKTVEYKAYEYVEPHEHVWANQYEPITTTVKHKDSHGNVTEVPYDGYHARRCTVEGCPEYSPKEDHLWSEYEVTTAATDHSEGERVRHCLVCGYEQEETLSTLYHKHDFPVKNSVSNWYELEDEREYVGHSNQKHYVKCRGVVYNEKTGEYEPCKARANYEPHHFSFTYIDGEDSPTAWAKFKITCRCGFSKIYKTEGCANQDQTYRLFSNFPNFKWEYDGETYYSDAEGNAPKIHYGATVTIYNETGYLLSRKNWNYCLSTVDDSYIQIIESDFYSVTFKMPMRDVFANFEMLDPATQLSGWECPHSNTYYDESTAIATTCTQSGKDPDLKCQDCHVIVEIGETRAALGHNFILDKNSVVYATCTTRGFTGNSVCANCGKVQRGVSIPAEGHEIEEGYYYWDDYRHWPYCVECEKEFKAQGEKHDMSLTVVSDGVTYECCNCVGCDYYRVKSGEETGIGYNVMIVTNDHTDNTDLTFRLYPATVSDEDVLKDMEKATSELGTECGGFLTWQGNSNVEGYTRTMDYKVLNLPQKRENYKFAVTLGKDYVPVVKSFQYIYGTCFVRLKEYGITFQANGASGSMESVTVKSGEKYTLPECGFTPTGVKTFLGWNVKTTDGTTLQSCVMPGTLISVDRDITCKAVWEDGIWINDIRLDADSDPSVGGKIFVDEDSVQTLMGTADDLLLAYIDDDYEYAWYADGEIIPGETGDSVTVTNDMAGKTIYAVLIIGGSEFKTNKIVVAPKLVLTIMHNIEFNNNIAMHYAIKKTELKGYSDLKLLIEKEQYDKNVATPTIQQHVLENPATLVIAGEEYWHFIFPGICGPEMGNKIKATLTCTKEGTEYASQTDVYSVEAYAYDRLENSKSDSYKKLLVDMLNYGAAAQYHFGINANHLVNADLANYEKYVSSWSGVDLSEQVEHVTELTGAKASFNGKNLSFDNKVVLLFGLNFTEFLKNLPKGVTEADKMANVKVKFTYNNGKEQKTQTIPYAKFQSINGRLAAYCDVIAPAEMGCTVTATIYDGETPISNTLQYSIEAYAKDRLDNTATSDSYKDLVRKMVLYGRAAKAHFK